MHVYGKQILDFAKGTLGSVQLLSNGTSNDMNVDFGNVPMLSKYSDKFEIKNEGCFQFKKSNEEADAGQSFLPYFDPVEANFDRPGPLSVIKLIHYTNDEKHAGFIRPFIKSIDYKKLMK